jgi:hypothetical protein
LFSEVTDGFRRIESMQGVVAEVGLADDETPRPDLWVRQSALFDAFAAAWRYEDGTIASALDNRIAQQGDDQSRFEREFRGQAWRILPIDDF